MKPFEHARVKLARQISSCASEIATLALEEMSDDCYCDYERVCAVLHKLHQETLGCDDSSLADILADL